MALGDVFLLSRLLQKTNYSLNVVFRVYDERRGPRVNKMAKTAERNGGVRKSTNSWRLAVNKTGASGVLWAYQAFSMDKWGLVKAIGV